MSSLSLGLLPGWTFHLCMQLPSCMEPTPQMSAELVPSPVFSALYWVDSGAQSCGSPVLSLVPSTFDQN